MTQAERIQQAVLRSIHSRDLYTEQQVNTMLKTLQKADTYVKAELVRIGDGTLLKKGLEVRSEQLRGVQQRIDEIIRDLKTEQTLLMKGAVKESYQKGIEGNIREFGELGFPHYESLTHADRVKMAGQVMSLTDRSALDFLVNYDLQLLGNVTRELADNIKQQIEAVKEKIASGLSELPALKPHNFQQALTKLDEMSQALSDVKKLLPEAEWAALKGQVEFAGESFFQSVKALSAGELKQIAKAAKLHHYQWESKDELIVLMTSTDKSKIEAVKAGIEAKWAKWAEKHGGKKGKVKPKPSPSKVTTLTPKPVIPNELTAADDAWQKLVESEPFKFQGRADIEGAHTKYFFIDEHGNKWLFKPVEEFRGYGDEAAYRIGRLIDPDAIEVRCIELDIPERGKLNGSIQKWRTNLKKELDFRDAVVKNLSASELEQLQREHVIDWLISNHDAHGKQFLRLKGGEIRGIDKSQLYKYLGDDKLSITYHPNHGWGEKEPFYNIVMRAWRDGTIDLDLQATYRYIRRVEIITDDAYTELLKSYAERRFRGQSLKLKQFYETALARKNNIRRDFEEFYTGLFRKRTGDRKAVFHFDVDVKELPTDKTARKWKHIPEDAEVLIEDARESGWQGKSLPVDIDDIEDQNVLLYTEKVKGKTRTVMRMKIRPEAERKLLAALSTGADDTIGQAAGSALADDLFYEDILTAVKSINYHIKQGDFNFNRQKIDQALKHRAALIKLSKKRDADLKAMARAYLKTLDKIDASVAANGKKKISAFDRFLKQEPVVKPSGDKITAVKRTILYGDQKQVQKGQIRVMKEDIEFGKYHHNFTSRGLEYRIDLGDGVEGIYRPCIKENYYAHQGQLELRIAADCTPETADKLLTGLERLGIEASFAAPADAEYMFLLKQAYILKEDTTPAWKKMLRGLDTGKASKAERVRALRQYWSDRLGIEDVTKIPGYDPEGRYSIMSSAWKKKREAGYRHQLRFDLTDEQIKRELKDYGLHHSLTDGTDVATVLDTILDHNGAMISTVEKVRIGVPVGGMSPGADMESGGASYFFTRIRKLPGKGGGHKQSGFYLKPELLRRMDAITYENDKYGRVTGNHVRQYRRTSIQDFKRIEARRSSDETIFKNEVTLLDNIQVVSVRNETERRRVLEVFRKHGVTKLPDGRRVQDIVTTAR